MNRERDRLLENPLATGDGHHQQPCRAACGPRWLRPGHVCWVLPCRNSRTGASQAALHHECFNQTPDQGYHSRLSSEQSKETSVAIGSEIERGPVILVYDQNGNVLFSKPKGSAPLSPCQSFGRYSHNPGLCGTKAVTQSALSRLCSLPVMEFPSIGTAGKTRRSTSCPAPANSGWAIPPSYAEQDRSFRPTRCAAHFPQRGSG